MKTLLIIGLLVTLLLGGCATPPSNHPAQLSPVLTAVPTHQSSQNALFVSLLNMGLVASLMCLLRIVPVFLGPGSL